MNNTKTNSLRKMGGVIAALSSTLAFANSVEAISLIGNYSSTNDGTVTNIEGGTGTSTQKALGFTLPTGADYQLNNIILRLQNYNTVSGDVALIQIYADAAKTSTSPLGAVLQSILFTNPTSSSDLINNFTFTPTSTFTFAANTRYWLLVDLTAGNYDWRANSPAVTPTGISGITFNGAQFSIDNGTSYTNSTLFNSFDINATAIPVPFEFEATGGLAMLGGAWLLRRHLKKKATKV